MNTAGPEETVAAYENAAPVATTRIGGRELHYATPNRACLWRVQTLLTKEPHTITWLNSMPEGSVMLDVGANVGMYTVYAGVLRGAHVFAFEPEAQNYAVLNRNLLLNNLSARAIAWCAALMDEVKFDKLYLSDTSAGGSCHSFGAQVNAHLQPASFQYAQGCVSGTIDGMIAAGAMKAPSFIKIDVDGFEHKVIAGARETLRNPALESLLVELNTNLPEHRAIIDFLASLGFRHDPGQFQDAQRADGFFKGVGECIFRR
jgi:FkbM family methyltransferase